MKRFAVPVLAALLIAALALRRPTQPAGPAFAVATPPASGHRRARVPVAAGPFAVVYVAGAVARPGLYRLPAGARADDAVRAAGGMRPGADQAAVNLAARVSDGDEVLVPRVGDATPRPRGRRPRPRASASPPPASVSLDAAGASELARVPGIGPALAARIVAFREADGPFATLDELLDVNGMTPARLDRASPYLTVP